jgi:hypothetical protein
MKNLIENLLKKHNNSLNNLTQELQFVSEQTLKACSYTDTTSLLDCNFLCLLAFEYKPKLILEIGTWVGMTSYSMALATDEDCIIHTVDNNDKFVDLNTNISKRIIRHPNIFSHQFLPSCDLNNIDMIFNDANISIEDCDKMYHMASDNFIFVTHDYFNSEGNYEKGYEAINNMISILNHNKSSYTLYTPDPSWYFTNEYNVNGCSALLICNKN